MEQSNAARHENDLVARALSGRTESFEALVSLYERCISQIAYRIVENAQDAEDVLPETFLKAVTVARNHGRLEGFVTANFDFIQHYRPLANVVRRPTAGSGRGYAITGHHEIMIPLLAAAILDGGR